MRILFVLLVSLLMLIPALAACGSSGSITPPAPTAEVSADPTVSTNPSGTETAAPAPSPTPALDPETEAVITGFIAAQNAHDWSAFLGLWTNEEQKYYKDFFAYPENEKNKNGYFAIKSAKLTGIYEIENVKALLAANTFFSLPYEIESGFRYDLSDIYGDCRLFIVKADYSLDKEFWDYREGTSYRVIVLVPENGQWKIAQDYQGYPGAAEYFGDTIPDTQDEEPDDIEQGKNDLVDGTVHYTKKLDCYFCELNSGDYLHMKVRTIEGDEMWFWMAHTNVDPETLTRYEKISITWENRDVYIDEAGKVINQDAIIDIKIID